MIYFKKISTIFTTAMFFFLMVSVVPNVMAGSATDKDQNMAQGSSQVVNEKININSADLETLTHIKGIGEKMAVRIINYRTTNGSFTKVEDLLNVKGIGEKTLNKIKPFITLT